VWTDEEYLQHLCREWLVLTNDLEETAQEYQTGGDLTEFENKIVAAMNEAAWRLAQSRPSADVAPTHERLVVFLLDFADEVERLGIYDAGDEQPDFNFPPAVQERLEVVARGIPDCIEAEVF
jgi:hypothetical protein